MPMEMQADAAVPLVPVTADCCCVNCGGCAVVIRGKRRSCAECGWYSIECGVHRGPKCKHCGSPLEVTHTGPWKDDQRERRYRCVICHLPKILIEVDPEAMSR